MTEETGGQEIVNLAGKIIERWPLPEKGYQTLDLARVLASLDMQDNGANRSLVREALKAADERSAKHSSTEPTVFKDRESFEKAMGLKRRKRK